MRRSNEDLLLMLSGWFLCVCMNPSEAQINISDFTNHLYCLTGNSPCLRIRSCGSCYDVSREDIAFCVKYSRGPRDCLSTDAVAHPSRAVPSTTPM